MSGSDSVRPFATVTAGAFTAALRFAVTACPAKPQKPALGAVQVESHGDYVRVSCASPDMAATECIPDVGGGRPGDPEGVVAMSAARVLDLVKGLTATAVVTLHQEGGKVRIAGDGVTYTVTALAVDECPALPDWSTAITWATLPGLGLASLVDVAATASKDWTLPTLMGVHLQVIGDRIRATATDRYRMTEWGFSADSAALDGAEVLIHADAVRAVHKHMGRCPSVTVGEADTGGNVVITGGRRVLVARNILGDDMFPSEYPRVWKLWPAEGGASVTVPSTPALKAVKQVGRVLPEGDFPVSLAWEDGPLTLSALSDAVSASAMVPADAAEPLSGVLPGGVLGLNPRYLAGAITSVGGESVTIRAAANRPGKPGMAVFTRADRPGFRVGVMAFREPTE